MRTVKRNPFLSGLCAMAVLGGMILVGTARADMTSDTPAGLLIFPKLVIQPSTDSIGPLATDTVVQISNTSADLVKVRCYLVNANSHCSNASEQVCDPHADPEVSSPLLCDEGAYCVQGWTETDFQFTLTQYQPISWRLSEGLSPFPLDGVQHIGPGGQFNLLSSIPRASEIPFRGEMKCFEVDQGDNPIAANDLKGEATIYTASGGGYDVRAYNAVGLLSKDFNNGDDTLCLGGSGTDECPEPEYNGCPNILILDHYFEGAPDPSIPAPTTYVTTDLTLVPCSEDFLTQSIARTAVQFLVFNEFEQRLSVSMPIKCFDERRLADIDTRPGIADDMYSIFSVFVQGTLTGQSRIRGVQTGETNLGHGLVGVAEEFHGFVPGIPDSFGVRSAAFNLHYAGTRDQGDVVRVPRE